jgi:hypothetical protein
VGEIGERLDQDAALLPLAAALVAGVTGVLGGSACSAAIYLCASLVSPGVILAWPILWETGSGLLRGRFRSVATPEELRALAKVGPVVFVDPACLVSTAVRVVGLATAPGTTPAKLIAVATALYRDGPTDLARALLEFGVAHRIRIKEATGFSQGEDGIVRASLADPVGIAAAGPLEAMGRAGFQATGIDEEIGHHRELGRAILLVAGVEPFQSTLGAIFLGHPLRSGALAALRGLRSSGHEVAIFGLLEEMPGASASLRKAGLGPALSAHRENADALLVLGDGSKSVAKGWRGMQMSFGERSPRAAQMRQCHVASDDPHAIVDVLGFAKSFARRRRFAATLVAVTPIATLGLIASGLMPPDQAISAAGLAGTIIANLLPQALRIVPRVANDLGDET